MKKILKVSDKQAFSLVELSIVLVILGLLVGGVLSGQSLIRAAELRSVSSEYQRYSTAVGTFRDKYFALPGDMSNAISFWATNGNGDGDGLIEVTATFAAADPATNEISTFWRALSSAALIEGSYTYIDNSILTAGTNNPRAKLSNAGWNVGNLGTVAVTSVVYFDGTYGNVLYFGGGTNATAPTGIVRPEEAWNIDTKMDDGRPATGSVTSLESQGSAVCSDLATDNAATRAAAVYSLANTTSTACSLVFKTGY